MADTKISAMTAGTVPLAGTELVPLVQSGGNVQTSVANLTAGRAVSAGGVTVTASTVPANGMYLSAANTLSWATNTTLQMSLSSTGALSLPNGAVTATATAVTGSTIPLAGMYLSGTNTLGWSTNTTLRMTMSTSTLTYGIGSSAQIININGGTGANVGAYLQFSRNSVATIYIGNEAAINGGGSTSSDLALFCAASIGMQFFTGATIRATWGSTGLLNISGGSFGRGAPVTKTGDFTLAATENWVISDRAATNTVTLPAASSWTGREVMFKTVQAQTLVSASSNVVPLAGGAAGTAILAATAGKWATLVSDGTNWIIMQGN